MAFQIQISRLGDCFTSYSIAMDADSPSQRRSWRTLWGGVPNYRNDILINVVEEYLPPGGPGAGGLEGGRCCVSERVYGGDSSSGGGPSGQLEQEALQQPHAEADR